MSKRKGNKKFRQMPRPKSGHTGGGTPPEHAAETAALHIGEDADATLMRRVLRSMIERFERELAEPERERFSISPTQAIAAMRMLEKLNKDTEREAGGEAAAPVAKRRFARDASAMDQTAQTENPAGHTGGEAPTADAGWKPALHIGEDADATRVSQSARC